MATNERSSLRWGLLSTAHITSDVIPGLRRSSKNELVAVASRQLESAQAFARENDIPKAFGTYEEMLADTKIDCVYIPLPNHLHGRWTESAIRANKHVLCEKPLVANADEASRLFRLAQDNGVHLAEAFMYRHHPKTHALKDAVRSGRLGEIHTLRAWFTYAAEDAASDIRFIPGMDGGALRDVGSYTVSMCNYIQDAEPDTVAGFQVCDDNEIDLRFYGLMHYPGPVVAMIDCSMGSHSSYGVTVVGSAGSATLRSPWYSHKPPAHLEVVGPSGDEAITPDGAENAYFLETENFADVIAGTSAPEIRADETIRTARTLTRLASAARVL